ncbi:MAG: HAMP domain-containing protein [Deltaproteobacteria bacterium]|nr:MAG: HAMP domain-containing protein [Deltaproteobacteria bacterium]
MGLWMRLPCRSLAGKFTVCTSLVLLVTIACFAYVTIEALRGVFLEEAQDDVETLSEIILHTTHLQMLEDNRDVVYKMMDEVGKHKTIGRIRLLDDRGTIRYSTHANEIGRVTDQPADDCQDCHCPEIAESFPPMESRRRVIRDCSGTEILSVTKLIENQPACSAAACHVHPPEARILGALEVQASLHSVGVHADTYRKNVLAFAVSLLLIIVGCLVWLTHHLVVSPVHSLLLHSRKVAQMELDSHVVPTSADELGALAREFNEMTDRLRQARSEYEQLTETLEAKVQERTAEIAQMHSQLVRSEKLASLGKLVAGIAHEINNPLAGILMFATLFAEDRSLPKEMREDARIIVRETQRCAEIVKRLLEFSRNSIPRKKLKSLPVIMDDTLALLEHQAALNEIEILRGYDPMLPEILVDPAQIEQVFVNMVVNACQAMPNGGRLDIAMRADRDRHYLVTTIADNGHGIPREHLPKIFDPFFTTKDHPGTGLTGTGLGLSVSYGIIQNHGGRIGVVSEVGRGTVFTVELPLAASTMLPAGDPPGNLCVTGRNV